MREGNYNVQTWLDIRTIASIIFTLQTRNIDVKSFSSAIKLILEDFEEHECASPFESVDSAVAFLNNSGFPTRQVKAKAGRGIRKSLRTESGYANEVNAHKVSELEQTLRESIEGSGYSIITDGSSGNAKEIRDSNEDGIT